MRTANTLFGRLFGVSLAAIVLGHLLAYIWFQQYGPPPPCRPTAEQCQRIADEDKRLVEQGQRMEEDRERPPPPPFGPIIVMLFQTACLVAAAWYGAKLLSRPIKRFSDAADRWSEDIDAQPMEETGPQEVRQAAHTFNQMRKRIREQVQQRARMLGAVSHDLRTPLSRLKLRLEQIDDEKLQNQMRQDLDDMIGMLDATLTYLHEQRTAEALQWFDLQSLVESLVENAQDHGARAETSGHCAPLQVQPMALRSCISNLLDNALRYAGSAHVELVDGRETVQIRVIDHGPGISAEKREAVFEAFYRLEGSRNRNSGGVGLGMTIAREAARRMGGDLALDETPGGGLTATLSIPRYPA